MRGCGMIPGAVLRNDLLN